VGLDLIITGIKKVNQVRDGTDEEYSVDAPFRNNKYKWLVDTHHFQFSFLDKLNYRMIRKLKGSRTLKEIAKE